MEVCFCGQKHKNKKFVKEFFYKNKCDICRYEREKELWVWFNENINSNINHNIIQWQLPISGGKYLHADFTISDNIFLELDEKGCDHIPYTSEYNKSENFQSIQSETRYRIKRMYNDVNNYMIRFPLEMCSINHFHKIREAMVIIENNKKSNEYNKIVVLVKNGKDDNRYDYLDNYINDFSKNELFRFKFEIIH